MKGQMDQNQLYAEAVATQATMIRRLARGYEADPDKQRDLLQDIHLELWLSLASFDGRCILRTWVYRIAHNVGASHVVRSRRRSGHLVDVDTLDGLLPPGATQADLNRKSSADSLLDLIHRLKPLDRQIIMLHLEGEAAETIAEVTGLSSVNVATKIHRIKKVLKQTYSEGAPDARTR